MNAITSNDITQWSDNNASTLRTSRRQYHAIDIYIIRADCRE